MQESVRERIKKAKYIICSCEGAAELDIIKLLLKEDLLLFKEEQVLFDGITNYRKASDIQEKFLGTIFDEKILILRILDSKNDKFNLKKPYNEKCEVININTVPEIEILLIIYFGKYDEYTKKYKNEYKPSQYCKIILQEKNIKKHGYMTNLFSGKINDLVRVLHFYKSKNKRDNLNYIVDLLK